MRASELTGYLHPRYPHSLSEFGRPRHLARSGGWILVRDVYGTSHVDAMGCYPLFACTDWQALQSDLEDLSDELVSVVVVTDPYGEFQPGDLERSFGDVVRPFKEHHVADLSRSPRRDVSKHHRYYARKAMAKVEVEVCADPSYHTDAWTDLYAWLVERHKIRGIRAFSRQAFALQLDTPGMVMLRAVSDGVMVGAHLWYVQNDVGYSHLAANSPEGYELMAAYALHWAALSLFRDRVRWLDFGAGAGLVGSRDDGLTRFKRGWASSTRTVYLCGRVLDRHAYRELGGTYPVADDEYFPGYREGELG